MMDRKEMTKIRDWLRTRLLSEVQKHSALNDDQVRQIVMDTLSGDLSAFFPTGMPTFMTKVDKQGRIALTVQLDGWLIKFLDINKTSTYEEEQSDQQLREIPMEEEPRADAP